MLTPQYPDGEQQCSDLAKMWMSRTSVNMSYRDGHSGSKEKVMVSEWRHAARRVVCELQRRGIVK
jgi:hypothetical protein